MVPNQEVARSGEIEINKRKDLGINDPLTHLFMYINYGEQIVVGIKEDIESDVAERLPKTPFANNVDFKFENGDFMSVKDHVSMKKMSTANLDVLYDVVQKDPSLQQEYDRAQIEGLEVEKLADWFIDAPINSFMVFESLPIGSQKVAMSRIYRKASDTHLEGSFVSLHKPTVALFNDLRRKLGSSDNEYYLNELALLANNYEFSHPSIISSSDFVDFYVDTYDSVLNDKYNTKTRSGLEYDADAGKQNGMEKVRQHPKLTSIYIEAVKTLSEGKGLVTPEIITICKRLHIDNGLSVGGKITTSGARELLKDVILGIAGVIDRADAELLNELERFDDDSSAYYDTVSFYSEEAARSGDNYDGICSEVGRTESSTNSSSDNSEYASLYLAFNVREKLNNFGKPKIGVCIIPGCSSHGKSKVFYEKTLVGGCNICVGCHKILQSGGSPEAIHAKDKEETEKKEQKAKTSKNKALVRKLGEKELERNADMIRQTQIAKNNKPRDWMLDRRIDRTNNEIKSLKKEINKAA